MSRSIMKAVQELPAEALKLLVKTITNSGKIRRIGFSQNKVPVGNPSISDPHLKCFERQTDTPIASEEGRKEGRGRGELR